MAASPDNGSDLHESHTPDAIRHRLSQGPNTVI